MRLIIILLPLLLGISSAPSSNITITCTITLEDFKTIGEIYTCEADKIIEIDEKNTEISFTKLADNEKVKGLKFEIHRMKFFPQGIAKTFSNLLAVYMNDGILSEIHQSDLQPFPQLRYLDFFENRIEVLEADLFKFNQHLEVIWLSNNWIEHINPNVFDHLTKLHYLYLMDNICIQQSETNRTLVLKLIEKVKESCSNDKKFTTTTAKPWRIHWSSPNNSNSLLFVEMSNKLKSCEEQIDMVHGLMEVMTTASEIKSVHYEEEIHSVRVTKNILWFCVVILVICVAGMAVLLFKKRSVVEFTRDYLL